MANDQTGFTGTWETLPSPSLTAGWSPAYQLQVDPRLPSRACEDESGTKRWYCQAKETKRGEMDGKESQCPIVVLKRGNGLPDPVERRGCRVVDGKLEPR